MTSLKPPNGVVEVAVSLRKDAVFMQCLQQASAGARALLDGLIADAAAGAVKGSGEAIRDSLLKQAVALLQLHKATLCERYPVELLRVFHEAIQPVADTRTAQAVQLRFDQLELMDDTQVQEKLELARAQQAAILDADVALAPLTALICAVRGMQSIRPDANPLRPASYVTALQNVFATIALPPTIRLDWLSLVSPNLGRRLREVYVELTHLLTAADVAPAAYVVTASPDGAARGRNVGTQNSLTGRETEDALESVARREIGLTVDQLRRLLAGELDSPQGQRRDPSTGSARSSGNENAGFDHTVPDGLTELRAAQPSIGVAASLERVESQHWAARDALGTPPQTIARVKPSALDATELVGLSSAELQDVLRQQADGMGQVVGLEVVALMIANMARDKHLLPAVQSVVRALEQPLLRLTLVDQRFFTDHQHPARQLLEAIAEHNARFESEKHPGFARFIQPLRKVVDDLQPVPIEGPEPFALSLATLIHAWGEGLEAAQQDREHAQNALRVAEQRNLIAAQVSAEIRSRPDAALVPESVVSFATGPWAQVIATAKMGGMAADVAGTGFVPSSSTDVSLLMVSVRDLFWSAHPNWPRANPSRLVKLIPSLLSRIRSGLKTIHYPQDSVNTFFDVLMAIHQKAMVSRVTPLPSALMVPVTHSSGQVWLAPQEAQVSGFVSDVELQDDLARASSVVTNTLPDTKAGLESLPPGASASALPLGSWVEMTVNRDPIRTQLVWASPQGSMYMFATNTGRNQSMTRSSVDKLIDAGKLLLVARQNIVTSALDAVAQAALHNSVDATS